MCLLCLCPRSMQVFLSPLPTNCEGSVPCFQIPRLGSVWGVISVICISLITMYCCPAV